MLVADPDAPTFITAGVPSGEAIEGPLVDALWNPVKDPAIQTVTGGFVLEQDSNRTWQDPINDTGTGSFEIPVSLLSIGYLQDITFWLFGQPVFPWQFEDVDGAFVDPGEEAGQVFNVSGRGVLAELEDMIVYPDLGAEAPSRLGPPGQDTRVFNFAASTGVNDDGWASSITTPPKYGLSTQIFPMPDGWPDRWSGWQWDREIGADLQAPAGTCYLRRVFGMPAGQQRCQIWASAYDELELWLDGTQIIDTTTAGAADHVELDLGDHFHLLAAKVKNRGGKAGLNVSILPVLSSGRLGSPIVRTSPAFSILAYSDPPRFTAGKILWALFAEGWTRGTCSDWSLAFGEDTDSNGNPWPDLTGYAIPVGTDMLGVLRQLAETELDFKAGRVGKVLYAARVGELGVVSGAQFVDGENVESRHGALGAR